ncbi:hypothetical protein [Methylocystis rosea]|uniref:Helix-turn-helix domain-containing protein n=1 Tax=Methylocystis rosea TaxID=173366 RepID=A0A3G8M4M5_9HYPH|nr:hypothetical protein [Methylocystis rosea]AZG75990.1 hypothetical protein EHO51_04160 [Methylocystis rosea]
MNREFAALKFRWLESIAANHQLSASACRLAIDLSRRFNSETRTTFVGIDTLAKDTGLSPSSVKGLLAALVTHGHLSKKSGGVGRGAANEYSPIDPQKKGASSLTPFPTKGASSLTPFPTKGASSLTPFPTKGASSLTPFSDERGQFSPQKGVSQLAPYPISINPNTRVRARDRAVLARPIEKSTIERSRQYDHQPGPTVFVEKGSSQWTAWAEYLADRGGRPLTAIQTRLGFGTYRSAEWPPGCAPAGPLVTAEAAE